MGRGVFLGRCPPLVSTPGGFEDMINARYSDGVRLDVRRRMSPPPQAERGRIQKELAST